jgi:hypothetical protein
LENTIWVNTDTAITSWEFSATEPTGAEGMVWISTGTESAVAFNVLKKNGIVVHPISAKQYSGGAWIDKTASIYQGGAWIDWWDGELYIRGQDYTNVTGGWAVGNIPPGGWSNYKSATLTMNATNMVFKGRLNTLYNNNKIDVTKYNAMVFKGSVNKWSTIRLQAEKSNKEDQVAYTDWSAGQTSRSLDISSLSGSYYICLSIFDSDNSTITLEEVYME